MEYLDDILKISMICLAFTGSVVFVAMVWKIWRDF